MEEHDAPPCGQSKDTGALFSSHGGRLPKKSFWYVLRKRREIVIATVLIVVFTTAALSWIQEPVYEATALVAGVHGCDLRLDARERREVANIVAEKLRQVGDIEIADLTAEKVLAMTKTDVFLSPVPEGDSTASITFKGSSATGAAKVANMLAEAYVEQVGMRMGKLLGAQFRQSNLQLDRAKSDFEKAEKDLVRSQEERQSSYTAITLLLEEFRMLTGAAASASVERIDKEARLRRLENLKIDELKSKEEIVNDFLVKALRTDELRVSEKLASLTSSGQDNTPEATAAKSELSRIQEAINGRIREVVHEANESYLDAKRREKSLRAVIQQKEKEMREVAQNEELFKKIESQAESMRNRYTQLNLLHDNLLLSATQELGREQGVRIVEMAAAPEQRSSPRTFRNVLVAAITGLLIGVGLATWAERVDVSLDRVDDVEAFLGKPCLGIVPLISGARNSPANPRTAAEDIVHSLAAESLQTILTRLSLKPQSERIKTILVTSAGIGEGKTLLLSNLGIAAALNGRKVLLVDCNLRRPKVHLLFKLSNQFGVSDFLLEKTNLEDIIQPTGIPNLSMVSAGENMDALRVIPPSGRMKQLAEAVGEKFEIAFFDSPATSVADSLVLANSLDATIFVIGARRYPGPLVARAVRNLESAGANLLGVVLTTITVQVRQGRVYFGGDLAPFA